MKEEFLYKKLQDRKHLHALRQLKRVEGMTDFCSNDYLGMVRNSLLEQLLEAGSPPRNYKHGSTGSRLLSGNYALIEDTESMIAGFHEAESAIMFNSGYDANVGLLSCVPQRGDTVLYDHLSHASIRDGIRLSHAQAFSFRHNDLEDLEKKIGTATGQVFVVTESLFSMDGDMPPLRALAELCERHGCHLVLDEAHATGIIGEHGEGLAQHLRLHTQCFARVHTFGKALGAHGAVVLGSHLLRDYLVNFSRPLMYTTALPESSVAAIRGAYSIFPHLARERKHLQGLVQTFQLASREVGEQLSVLHSDTPIQGIMVPGNAAVKETAALLQLNRFDVRPIMYPTVPQGSERLRIVLHSYNTKEEVEGLVLRLRSGFALT
jgi:8-amino-7-oxononanoate synthase